MDFSLGGSFESFMAKNQTAYGGAHIQMGDLESIIKSFDHVAEEIEEPTSVLELSQCISPPLSQEVWAQQEQQRKQQVLQFEQQLQQQVLQQQQIFQWQQQQREQQQQQQQQQQREQQAQWENHLLWEQQQAEIAELQYLQTIDRQSNYTNIPGFEAPGYSTPDPHHVLQSTWDTVQYDPYQCSVGSTDPMNQTLNSDPWVDFQQPDSNVFGSQLMQGLPCLEDPLILESWMTSCSSDSSLTSVSTEVESPGSNQSFLTLDEHHESLSNSGNQNQMNCISRSSSGNSQQQVSSISRCSSARSTAAAPEGSSQDLVSDTHIEDCHYDMQLAMDSFNPTAAPMCVDTQSAMEDIKPSPNWYPGVQDSIGPQSVGQEVPPSPGSMASSATYSQSSSPSVSRTTSPVPPFQITIPTSESINHLNHHREFQTNNTNSNNFINSQQVPSTVTEMKPSPRLFETPISVVTTRPQAMVASTPSPVEVATKPNSTSGKLQWGPCRPGSDSMYSSRSVSVSSEPPMTRRRIESTPSQKSGLDHHHGQKRHGSNFDHRGGHGHNKEGAGRVVTLAELASGGVKMGGVQLPTVGTQIPSVVRLAVETQASGMGGVRMVQVLLACAEAVACRDSRQANILLQQLQHMACPYGDAMQRITACFVEGLSARLAITGSQPFKFTNPIRKPPSNTEKREGFNLVYQSSPYVAFGHFAANSAILEAFEGEDRMHIVDLGMTHSLQWPYLIHGLAKRPSGPPKLLRITGFGLSVENMTEAGEELARVAAEAKVPFEFLAVEGPLEDLKRSKLELREGEALAVNSVLQLHCVVKESRGSLNAVLQSIHELSPKILTLVEQDASHNGPFFLGRFMEALHYYSAIFDSLDAILPRNSEQRVKMEQFHFAEEIKNIVSCEGPARVERHERVDQWRRRMSRAGFQPLPLKFLSQARLWLGLYSCEGYTLSEEKGCLVLGWKGKPIIAASSWKR
ncbi:unnamed protein product [Calypogeia fissa]